MMINNISGWIRVIIMFCMISSSNCEVAIENFKYEFKHLGEGRHQLMMESFAKEDENAEVMLLIKGKDGGLLRRLEYGVAKAQYDLKGRNMNLIKLVTHLAIGQTLEIHFKQKKGYVKLVELRSWDIIKKSEKGVRNKKKLSVP